MKRRGFLGTCIGTLAGMFGFIGTGKAFHESNSERHDRMEANIKDMIRCSVRDGKTITQTTVFERENGQVRLYVEMSSLDGKDVIECKEAERIVEKALAESKGKGLGIDCEYMGVGKKVHDGCTGYDYISILAIMGRGA